MAGGSSHCKPEDGYWTYIPSHSLVLQDLSPSLAGYARAILLIRGVVGKDGSLEAGTEMLSQCPTSKIDLVQLICVHIERNTQNLNENYHLWLMNLSLEVKIDLSQIRKYPIQCTFFKKKIYIYSFKYDLPFYLFLEYYSFIWCSKQYEVSTSSLT